MNGKERDNDWKIQRDQTATLIRNHAEKTESGGLYPPEIRRKGGKKKTPAWYAGEMDNEDAGLNLAQKKKEEEQYWEKGEVIRQSLWKMSSMTYCFLHTPDMSESVTFTMTCI